MNKYIYILILLFSVCSANSIKAQVTIGSDDAPKPYSALQIDGTTGGLRLPQLTLGNRGSLSVSSTQGVGLTIYNTTTNTVEYWDGSNWTAVSNQTLTARNGLTRTGNIVKLGGSLIQQTDINLDGNALNFLTGTGTHNVTNTNSTFLVNNKVVNFATPAFSVNSTIFTVDNANKIMLTPYVKAIPANSGKLTITTGANKLTVDNTNVTIDGKLSYVDGRQGADRVLVARNDGGEAFWGLLRPDSEIRQGILATDATINRTATNITTKEIDLDPGIWMIFTKFAATSTSSGMFIWTGIFSRDFGTPAGTNEVSEIVIGKDMPDEKVSYPEVTYLLEVTTKKTINIQTSTTNAGTNKVSNAGGEPYFFAVLIDKAQ